jgi:hypothetical protein
MRPVTAPQNLIGSVIAHGAVWQIVIGSGTLRRLPPQKTEQQANRKA